MGGTFEMFSSDDQLKPALAGPWNVGPETAPQPVLLYHGLGTPHSLAYTSNPVSWLVGPCHLIPFLSTSPGNAVLPTDAAIADQLSPGYSADIGSFGGAPDLSMGPLQDTTVGGGYFQQGYSGGEPYPVQAATLRPTPVISGFAANGVPIAQQASPNPVGGQSVGTRTVALWGSRKTGGF